MENKTIDQTVSTGTSKQTIDFAAEIARLQAENARLQAAVTAKTTRSLSFKVTEKGGVSVYGLNNRFPVTLYGNQWQKLLADDVRSGLLKFIEANKDTVSFDKAKV